MTHGEDESPERQQGHRGDAPNDAEIIESLPEKAKEEIVRRIFRAESYRYQAPLPPPSWMEHFNRIVPGSAKLMTDDVHEQQAHRRRMEEKEIDASIRLSFRGQWMGFTIVMVVVVGGLALALLGVTVSGGVGLAFLGLAALAAVFVTNARRGTIEARENREASLPIRQEDPSDESQEEQS